ncbi:glycosyltransferase family 2 protein [Spirosoma validum]|uniref:Glycosyltransferase n=1 Tax=Spirosoma validum TaxID=2771355 RepID=A0A927AZL6_9BACT|nr:glycosyltransferase family 2 protein [Spirosoma validum]MBD2752567.1 glycosyltransferase [Spirosoma validum]
MIPLSIITINLNNAAGLEKTARSVNEQTFLDFEYIIIDGGSTDKSVEMIDKFSDRITYSISEHDQGIYHAMNKGIKRAKGEYCLFLNSGDWLATPTILEEVFAKKPQADVVAGDIYFYDNQKQTVQWHVTSPEEITAKTLFLGTLPHQATFVRRRLFDLVGLYNEQLRIASDWLFFVEALLVHQCSYAHYPAPIAYFNMDGISCNPATNGLPRQEQRLMLQARYPRFMADYEQLDKFEKERQQWFASREYAVYLFLERSRIIQSGVFLRRIKRFVLRMLARRK